MRKRIGVRVETFVGAGVFQHDARDIGITPKTTQDRLPEEVVDLLKKVNELLYEQIPEGAIYEIHCRADIKYSTRNT